MDGSLARDGAGDKFVGSHACLLAILDDLYDGSFPDELAALGVVNLAGFEEHHGVGLTGVDVQRASLPPLIEHLNDPRQIQVRQISAERSLRRGEHLGWLESVPGTKHERADVRGNVSRIPAAVDEIIAAG